MAETKAQLEETVALLRAELRAEIARNQALTEQNTRLIECLLQADAQYRKLVNYIMQLRAWLGENCRQAP